MREPQIEDGRQDTALTLFYYKSIYRQRGESGSTVHKMTLYRVIFQYGTWKLWADIECPIIDANDRRGFADLAQNAVSVTLDTLPQVEKGNVAHDYTILKRTINTCGMASWQFEYSFETLANE